MTFHLLNVESKKQMTSVKEWVPFFNAIIYAESFKGLEVEWWFDGQGCDNSAIGVAGAWELLVA